MTDSPHAQWQLMVEKAQRIMRAGGPSAVETATAILNLLLDAMLTNLGEAAAATPAPSTRTASAPTQQQRPPPTGPRTEQAPPLSNAAPIRKKAPGGLDARPRLGTRRHHRLYHYTDTGRAPTSPPRTTCQAGRHRHRQRAGCHLREVG